MGFNNWDSTHCRDEFNETMIRGIADKFVQLGLKLDAGYHATSTSDDCLSELAARDPQGNLMPNPERFPSGIKALAKITFTAKGLEIRACIPAPEPGLASR